MSAGAIPYPIVPPLPEYEQRKTIHGPETRQLVPEQRAVLDQQAALEQAQIAATGEQTEHAKAVARVEQELAQQQADEQQRQIDARAKAEADAERDIGAWKQQVSTAYNAAMNAPTPSLFANRSTPEKVWRGLGYALMAIGDAGQAAVATQQGRSPPASMLHDVIERDLADQRAAVERLRDNVVMARTGLKDAQAARDLMLAQVDARGAAIYKRLETAGRARLASLKADKATIDQHQTILDLREKGVAFRQAAVAPLYRKIEAPTVEITNRSPTATGAGGGVEADKNAANFDLLKEHGQWLAEHMGDLSPDEIAAINSARTTATAAGKYPLVAAGAARLGIDAESGLSPRAKEYLDRMSRAEDAIGRLKSGGAINQDEGNRFAGMLAPKPSDKPETIGMRSKNIVSDIDNLGRHVARPARAPVPDSPPAAAPPAAAPAAEPPTVGPQPDRRTQLLNLLKRNPTDSRLRVAAKRYGIAPEEYGGQP